MAVFVLEISDADFGGRADPDRSAFEVEAVRDELGLGWTVRPVSLTPREFQRAPACTGGALSAASDNCSPAGAGFVGCPSGITPTPPLWMREQQADGTWGPWTVVTWYTCPSEADLIAAIEREWTELRPAPTEATLQPATGRVYATVPTVAIADPSDRLHGADILGAQVTIRATPERYTWSWGDGDTTTTEDPGAPYPHATVTHSYGRALDVATVTLTTTWSGQYRIGTGPWNPFDTTIATTSPGMPLQVLHPRTQLVDGPAR